MGKTAVIGLGKTGFSCLNYLYGKSSLVVVDSRLNPPKKDLSKALFPDVEFQLGAEIFDSADVERVVVSPGIELDSPLVAPAIEREIPVLSDIDLFCETTNEPICAITGTNGKSTVTSLVGHLFQCSGYSVGVGGNLGRPALDMLDKEYQLYILELSSFQLECTSRQRFLASTILNISEDHMDRHGSYEIYASIKQKIYMDSKFCVFNRQDLQTKPINNQTSIISFGADLPDTGNWGIQDNWLVFADRANYERIIRIDSLPLLGAHNEMNVLAGCALASAMGLDFDSITAGIKSFEGLPHRCQLVSERFGVKFYNDSKATNVGATIAAIRGLGNITSKNLILIAGGDAKKADLSPLEAPISRFVKAAVLMGKDAALIDRVINSNTPVVYTETMLEAVAKANELAESGDFVLLSPACTSLDMFSSFEERGRKFVESVKQVLE